MKPEVPLPQLVEASSTYKLFVPRKVEEKIRYLIRKFPNTEWSGVLFYTHSGSFEGNDLEIHCEDLFPMDLGTGGWTEFKMNEDVTAYIADNLVELFNCDQGLIHSHHKMGAFFSGQDKKTLQLEGNDTNCFVSLIVDTAGTYKAAITRKIQTETEVITKTLGSSYEFFGDGQITTGGSSEESTKVISNQIIEYFMLDVDREVVDNPFDFLDNRFNEIMKQKHTNNSSYTSQGTDNTVSIPFSKENPINIPAFPNIINTDKKVEEPTLFTDEEMEEMVDFSAWEPDPTTIHYMVCQMITCSFIINKDIDLKQWINKWMDKKYSEVFTDELSFEEWKEFIVDYMVNHYNDESLPAELVDDLSLYNHKIAYALYSDLYDYGDNSYLNSYKECLTRYIYE